MKAAVSLLCLVLAAGCAIHEASPAVGRDGRVVWQNEDLTFRFPATWHWFPAGDRIPSRIGPILGYLATVPIDVDGMCTTTANSMSCDYRNYHLEPGTLAVMISLGGHLGGGGVWPEPFGQVNVNSVIGGMPARAEAEQTAEDTQLLRWWIARPDSVGTVYIITAEIRGPGEGFMRGALDRLIASLNFVPPVRPLPRDEASAAVAATDALAQLRSDPVDAPAYACMPDAPGSRTAFITRLPNMSFPLRKPLPVTCSLQIEASRWNMWHLTLTFAWGDAADRDAGEYTVTQWVTRDGTLGARSTGGDDPIPYQ